MASEPIGGSAWSWDICSVQVLRTEYVTEYLVGYLSSQVSYFRLRRALYIIDAQIARLRRINSRPTVLVPDRPVLYMG